MTATLPGSSRPVVPLDLRRPEGVELVLDHDDLTPAPDHATYIANRMRDHGILISTDGPLHNVLKLKPPMVFTAADAERLVVTLDKILSEDRLQV